jgi:hypothetical protein
MSQASADELWKFAYMIVEEFWFQNSIDIMQ